MLLHIYGSAPDSEMIGKIRITVCLAGNDPSTLEKQVNVTSSATQTLSNMVNNIHTYSSPNPSLHCRHTLRTLYGKQLL